jgi:hypothetical protein
MIGGVELRILRGTRSFAESGAATQERFGGCGIGTPVGDRFVLRDDVVVAGGKRTGAKREGNEKAEKEVHGSKCVG